MQLCSASVPKTAEAKKKAYPSTADGGSGRQRRRSSFDGPPRVVQPQQQQQPVTTMHRSSSCGNGRRCSSDGRTSTQKQSRSSRDFKSPDRAAALEYYVQSFHSLTQSNRKSPGVTVNNNDFESDASRRFHGHFQQLPFVEPRTKAATPTTSSPRHPVHPHFDSNLQPPPPPRSSQHHVVGNSSSQLPRRDSYGGSKGINVNNLQPPPPAPRRMLRYNTQTTEMTATASSSSPPPPAPYGVPPAMGVSQPRPAPRSPNNTHNRSDRDDATSRLRDLCLDIIQSAKDGTSPPQRSQIKEAVVDYHRSRNNAISPRDPNFTEIPSEFSHVLTYGLARSQQNNNNNNNIQTTTVPRSTSTMEALEQQHQLHHIDTTNQQTVLKGRATTTAPRRSRFSEIKDEGEGGEGESLFYASESRLNTTIELGPSDVVSCVSLPSTVDHHGLD